MNQIFSERFKSARLLNGLSLQDLADKLENKVSRQALHKYEKGEVVPDSEMIGLLADALNIRPDYFFRETKVEIGEICFRKLKNLPAKDENKIVEQTREYLSRYLELEEIIGLQTIYKNPLEEYSEPITCFKEVEKAAVFLRKKWDLGTDPIYNAVELLEDNHIKVVELEEVDGFDGLQTWVNGNIPVIVINKSRLKKEDRKRFTVMHELGHLLLTSIKSLPEAQQEKLCHQFAAAMLFPSEAMINELGEKRNRLLIQELGTLKQQYGISIQAIVMRARDLEIISDNYCKQFFFYLKQMHWKVEEPKDYDYEGTERATRFTQLIFRALAEELISMSKAASLSNQKLAEFRSESLMVG